MLKSVYIYGSYRKNKTGVPFFWNTLYMYSDNTSVSSSSIVMLPLPLITQIVNVSLEPLTLLSGLVNIMQSPSISAPGPSFLFLISKTTVQWQTFWLHWFQWQNCIRMRQIAENTTLPKMWSFMPDVTGVNISLRFTRSKRAHKHKSIIQTVVNNRLETAELLWLLSGFYDPGTRLTWVTIKVSF